MLTMNVFTDIYDFVATVTNPFELVMVILKFIGMFLCGIIYGLISWLYQVFLTVGRLNILSNGAMNSIYQRVTIILTIVMVFYITFEFVKYVVQPDTISDKEKGAGAVVKRMIIAIVLIAFVPTIFEIAYDLQGKIIDNQVIPQIILGTRDEDYNTLGSDFAANMMSLFLRPNEEICDTNASDCQEAQTAIDEQIQQIRQKSRMNVASFSTLFKKGTVGTKRVSLIDFDGILAIAVGGFIVYVLVLYCIDVGTRYAQLVFLQIMAPIAIIGYVSPKKDGIFQKWTKQCITTYLDLFIRLVLINLILLIIKALNVDDVINGGGLFAGIPDASFTVRMLAYVAIVMGLLVFAQKAPKMLKELFPSSGEAGIGFGFNAKQRFEPTTKLAKNMFSTAARTAGTIAGVAGGFSTYRKLATLGTTKKEALLGGFKAGYQGVKAGAAKQGGIRKAQKAVSGSREESANIKAQGGNIVDATFHPMREKEVVSTQKREINKYQEFITKKESVGKIAKDDLKSMKLIQDLKKSAESTNNTALLARLGGDMKAVEKASTIYANNKTQANLDNLTQALKSAIQGTGVLGDFNMENALKIDLAKTTNPNFIQNVVNGTLTDSDRKLVASLNTTNTLTNEIKQIINKDASQRTDEDKKKLSFFLQAQQDSKNDLDKFVGKYLDLGSADWDHLTIAVEEAKRVVSDINDIKVKVERNGVEVEVPVDQLTDDEFATKLGEIAGKAGTTIAELNRDQRYREAQANSKSSDNK